MIRVFQKVRAKCRDCEEPVDETYRIGKYYYCASDYQMRVEDKVSNKLLKKEVEQAKQLLKPYVED